MTRREVKRFLRRKRISQGQIAEVCGVSRVMVCLWLSGRNVSEPLKQKIETYIREQSQPVEQPQEIGAA